MKYVSEVTIINKNEHSIKKIDSIVLIFFYKLKYIHIFKSIYISVSIKKENEGTLHS